MATVRIELEFQIDDARIEREYEGDVVLFADSISNGVAYELRHMKDFGEVLIMDAEIIPG
jgi:hypothetical protein